jgi:molybdenum cofactor biosynthesis enzyme MoaA
MMSVNDTDGAVKGLFLYLLYRCNLTCHHCYMGERRGRNDAFTTEGAAALLTRYEAVGVQSVVLLGGEPTLHPGYGPIVGQALDLGFQRVIVDTNGTGRDPVSTSWRRRDRLAVRFSFEGADAKTQEMTRPSGAFDAAVAALRKVAAMGIRVEVTLTLHRGNVDRIEEMVVRFGELGAAELNFHFLSPMGRARKRPALRLEPDDILSAQRVLEGLSASSPVPLRYPRLLVPGDQLTKEAASGLRCRLYQGDVHLIFPSGPTLRCPLEMIQGGAARRAERGTTPALACPLSDVYFPQGLPRGYAMTCISWKGHR